MKQGLLYIDADRYLYRGFGRRYPIIAWNEAERRWTAFPDFGVPPEEWGELISQAEAERCYPGSTTAQLPAGIVLVRDLSFGEMIRYRPELFDGYDGPITRRSPEEIERYADSVMSTHVRSMIAKKAGKRILK
jgi:hypothetical protein